MTMKKNQDTIKDEIQIKHQYEYLEVQFIVYYPKDFQKQNTGA